MQICAKVNLRHIVSDAQGKGNRIKLKFEYFRMSFGRNYFCLEKIYNCWVCNERFLHVELGAGKMRIQIFVTVKIEKYLNLEVVKEILQEFDVRNFLKICSSSTIDY